MTKNECVHLGRSADVSDKKSGSGRGGGDSVAVGGGSARTQCQEGIEQIERQILQVFPAVERT